MTGCGQPNWTFLLAFLGQLLRGVGGLGEVADEKRSLRHGVPLPILHHHVVPAQVMAYTLYRDEASSLSRRTLCPRVSFEQSRYI
jgi:hypothetical protein